MPGRRTCEGACCAVFPLPKDAIERLKGGANGPRDAAYILDMLIPLTRRQALRRWRMMFGSARLPSWGRWANYYTCRHFDTESRLCTAYADRPAMCRSYPYEGECNHVCTLGCTYRAPLKVQRRLAAERRRQERTTQ